VIVGSVRTSIGRRSEIAEGTAEAPYKQPQPAREMVVDEMTDYTATVRRSDGWWVVRRMESLGVV